jgi:hypothetical protein
MKKSNKIRIPIYWLQAVFVFLLYSNSFGWGFFAQKTDATQPAKPPQRFDLSFCERKTPIQSYYYRVKKRKPLEANK